MYTFAVENGSSLISQRLCGACVRARVHHRHHQWALNDAAPLLCIKQTSHILHMCCLFNASDCGNGGYCAGCYASLLLTQVNHCAAEAWLVPCSSQVPGGGWVMFYYKCIMAMEHVRIINDKCVALAQQTRHTDTWNCPAQVKLNTRYSSTGGKKNHLSALLKFEDQGKEESCSLSI